MKDATIFHPWMKDETIFHLWMKDESNFHLWMKDESSMTHNSPKNSNINNILKQNEQYVEASMGQKFFDDLGLKHQPKYM
jgi:hypothetical protein